MTLSPGIVAIYYLEIMKGYPKDPQIVPYPWQL